MDNEVLVFVYETGSVVTCWPKTNVYEACIKVEIEICETFEFNNKRYTLFLTLPEINA